MTWITDDRLRTLVELGQCVCIVLLWLSVWNLLRSVDRLRVRIQQLERIAIKMGEKLTWERPL